MLYKDKSRASYKMFAAKLCLMHIVLLPSMYKVQRVTLWPTCDYSFIITCTASKCNNIDCICQLEKEPIIPITQKFVHSMVSHL